MKLIIAEKPDLGRDIAKALPGSGTETNGVITKGEYVVTWVFGHLMQLKEPEDYNPELAKWELEQLPIYFPKWETKVSADKKNRVKQIGELVKAADLIIHAGDPDDEGQLLIDELLRYYQYPGPVMRLDTGDTTTPALQRALNTMCDNKQLESAGWSAYARSVSDYLVGINMSRFFTLKNNRKLSVGRVQTPTLGLVVNRDLQIDHHKKMFYYELLPIVKIDNTEITAKFHPDKKSDFLVEGRALEAEVLQSIQEEIDGMEVQCNITKKGKTIEPPLPFNLVKLQSYCGKKWGYKPAEVMSITQSLRENYHAISYNRSDCQYLSTEHYHQAPSTVKTVLQNLNLQEGSFDVTRKGRCFNDENITAHFAIIPTDNQVNITPMSDMERNVYQAICTFYLAQFLSPCHKEVTSFDIPISSGSIKASASRVLDAGYSNYLTESTESNEEDDNNVSLALMSIPEGIHNATLAKGDVAQKETKPLARYTQSTLNEDMTRIAKYVKDPEVKKLLLAKDKDKKGENGSIGTSATRSTIIAELIRKGFLSEEGGKLISTPVGREFYRILPDELKLPDMTAKWYVLQEEIKTGEAPELLINNVLDTIKDILRSDHETIDAGIDAVGQCPICKQKVLDRAKGFFCENPDCCFVIWKSISGKTITAALAEQLLSRGRTSSLSGFKSKTGSTFAASLKIDLKAQENRYVTFEFEQKKTTRSPGSSKTKRQNTIPKRRWG